MFDIGWSEIAIIAMIALIVIGPKDLPKVLKTIGQWVGKARALTREFQKGVEDVIKEAELDEVRDQITAVKDFDIKDQVQKTIDPDAELATAFDITMDENMSETAGEEEAPAKEKPTKSAAKKTAAKKPARKTPVKTPVKKTKTKAKAKAKPATPLASAEQMPTIAAPEESNDKDKA